MSVMLMGTAKEFVRGAFTAKDVVTVDYYGGEFSGEDVVVTGFKCPAILIAGLGWSRPRGGERMAGKGVRVCHMAAFAVTNENNRADRMLSAQRLAERLDLALTTWTPANDAGAPLEVAAPEEDVRCENVYGRKVDAKGLALWVVTWRQCVKAQVPLPQLYELLSLDIQSIAQIPRNNQSQPVDDYLVVTHELKFQQTN